VTVRAAARRGSGWRYTRGQHETCLIAARGKMASKIRDHSIRAVFHAPVPWTWR